MVKRAVRYQFERKQLFEIVRHHINYYTRSTVTFPICIVSAVTGIDGLIDMAGSDFDCNYTDRNQHACFESHLNPSYMNIESAPSLRNSHFVIRSKT